MAMGKAGRQVVETVVVAFFLWFLSLDEVGNWNMISILCARHTEVIFGKFYKSLKASHIHVMLISRKVDDVKYLYVMILAVIILHGLLVQTNIVVYPKTVTNPNIFHKS